MPCSPHICPSLYDQRPDLDLSLPAIDGVPPISAAESQSLVRLPDPVDAAAQRDLRNALGSFATGVTVITAWDGVAPHGITVNSFTSVSLAPPLILWCVAETASCAPVFVPGRDFSVHVLASDQEEVALRFARRSGDKFEGHAWSRGPCGVPRLPGCAAEFRCRVTERLPGGDHWIVLGEVLAHEVFERAPLLFHRGRFTR